MEGRQTTPPIGPKRRRRHRLPPAAYRGRVLVAFTACARDRDHFLADPELVGAMVPLLARASAAYGCTVPVYTFMPDHLHVLILGMREDSDAKSAMDKFKDLSGQWLFRHRGGAKWQEGYYDHIVDGLGPPDEQVPYIALNPVRAGLVTHPLDWPYSGAIGHDLGEILGIRGRQQP